ncbi:hypothetical protein [uncultured Thiodictyon sp.]|uniref:hypothetical protein n=1 Tax=uncultured Thiodictyon sp. TaxID=1846217 RepID=UPI0025E2809D|nr:hypothetical protein [uncultured Thiodictyon sp.]
MNTQLTLRHPLREMELLFDHYSRAMQRAWLRHEERSAVAQIAESKAKKIEVKGE